jgi:hypothetical protein
MSVERVNDFWLQIHGDTRLEYGERFIPAEKANRPILRRALCLMRVCGGTVESDDRGIWWKCARCNHVSGFTERAP